MNMTVRALRKALEQFDDNAPVMFAYNYGDHWHTLVAEPVKAVEDGTVMRSEYHRMDKVVMPDDDHDAAEARKSDERPAVLLLADASIF